MIREPLFAGSFYDAKPEDLKNHITEMTGELVKKTKALGIIAPHAGYIYSGVVAAQVYSAVEIPKTIIILGPNHTGLGEPISVFSEGKWKTPLGDVAINESLATDILKKCKTALKDTTAHAKEHSIEVQLPFLQYHNKNFDFVPIVLGDYSIEHLKELAVALAKCIEGKEVLIIASSDLTHYEEAESARAKDALVLDSIEALDPDNMYDEIKDNDISMCGWMPVYVLLQACNILGAKKGKIIKYTNSGDVNGDYSEVVGYGGAIII
ncbi:MAG: AmmeMemoRadiSam system protein B [bacterium]